MARSIFYRTKTPQGPWARAVDDLPFTISGLAAGTYQIEIGDGEIHERTVTAGASNLLPAFATGVWTLGSSWSLPGGGIARRSGNSASGNLSVTGLTLTPGATYNATAVASGNTTGIIRCQLLRSGSSIAQGDNQTGNGLLGGTAWAGLVAPTSGSGTYTFRFQGLEFWDGDLTNPSMVAA